ATNLSTNDTSEFSQVVSRTPVMVQFAAASYFVDQKAGAITIDVRRTGNPGSLVMVNYATGGGSAQPGTNYTNTSGTLIFNPGQTSQSFTIPIRHDGLVTGPLSVGIALSSPGGGFLGDPSSAVLTIDDVDKPGVLQFGGATLTVSPAAGVANVTVIRVGG